MMTKYWDKKFLIKLDNHKCHHHYPSIVWRIKRKFFHVSSLNNFQLKYTHTDTNDLTPRAPQLSIKCCLNSHRRLRIKTRKTNSHSSSFSRPRNFFFFLLFFDWLTDWLIFSRIINPLKEWSTLLKHWTKLSQFARR